MYSIFDTQLRRLMLTGRNSPTKEAAKDDLLHYLSADRSREELAELSKLTPDELAAHCHCRTLKHTKPNRPTRSRLRYNEPRRCCAGRSDLIAISQRLAGSQNSPPHGMGAVSILAQGNPCAKSEL
jgi:hypothetical protein